MVQKSIKRMWTKNLDTCIYWTFYSSFISRLPFHQQQLFFSFVTMQRETFILFYFYPTCICCQNKFYCVWTNFNLCYSIQQHHSQPHLQCISSQELPLPTSQGPLQVTTLLGRTPRVINSQLAASTLLPQKPRATPHRIMLTHLPTLLLNRDILLLPTPTPMVPLLHHSDLICEHSSYSVYHSNPF